ncbi:hypothetical protein CBR_g6671 [Chara braunii]|uniref:Uncharacterized protein n=1 Tax=Chara braunii TaxID=69332 RepID=A0A388KKF7_CHABU|nr:hypothetical protein CBR_g6671 [Chara braunii]|eukprot:GBG70545.1 hypothetical protein CBR_g6671 [Chara braunii]
MTTSAVREERQHALVSTSVVPRAGQIAAKDPTHAQAPPPAPKKFRSVGVKEPLSVLHDIVRTSSMCAEPMYGAMHRGVQPLYFGDPGEGSSGEGSQREEEEEEEGSQEGNDSENTISDRERRGWQSKKMGSGNFAPTGVKLSTAMEQVDEGCEGGQSVTTTLTAVTVTDNEWCDGSGASVFPVGEKGNIGSPQGHMWMSMDILPYGLGSQGRLKASLDETMYLAETEQQLEAHTPLDEETLRGDFEIPTEFQSSISEEKAQRGSQEAGTVTGYQEEAMLAEEMEPGGEPNGPFDEDIPGSDFDTGTGGSQDLPIVFDTAGKNDILEGLEAKEAIQVSDIEEDEEHIVLTTPEQQTPVEEGRESTLRTPVQQFSPSVKVINIEESPFTSRQFRDAKEDGAQGKTAVSRRGEHLPYEVNICVILYLERETIFRFCMLLCIGTVPCLFAYM